MKIKKENYKKLRKLMRENKLTVNDVSGILKISQTRIYSWLTENEWQRNMPDQMLELLKIKLLKIGIKCD